MTDTKSKIIAKIMKSNKPIKREETLNKLSDLSESYLEVLLKTIDNLKK
jgi:hypothetical protein